MRLKEIHHVSLNVQDVEAASRFYVDVLGLEIIERPDLGFPGTWLTTGRQEIHLLGIAGGEPVKQQHFAFLVDDLEAVRSELAAAGVPLSKTTEIPGVCLQAFTHDPSHNMIEFNQRL